MLPVHTHSLFLLAFFLQPATKAQAPSVLIMPPHDPKPLKATFSNNTGKVKQRRGKRSRAKVVPEKIDSTHGTPPQTQNKGVSPYYRGMRRDAQKVHSGRESVRDALETQVDIDEVAEVWIKKLSNRF